ncbi:MAG TPA: ABC transporter ATP-binding protein [Acetobacteraceae bacterium]|nr:ABC transporter ATP-binding protein [Acetobacteraceae bacterium]
MILDVSDLRSGYATGDVLQGVSLALEGPGVIGVVGRNGVGKTTLMRTIIGLLPARQGAIRLRGEDVTRFSAEDRARSGVGYVPQGRGMFPNMTVLDNLRTGRFIGGGRGAAQFDLVYGYFPFLRQRAKQLAGTLSGGQQEMLAIARALIGGPDLLLLDEPSDGVQPSIVDEIGDFLIDLVRTRGMAVLIVEQNVDLVRRVVDRAHVLEKGRIVATLGGEEIRDGELLAEHLAI